MGIQPNVAAGLSYVFGWVSGLIFFFMEKQNRFVRFHAMQSIIFFGSLTVLITVLEFFLVFFPVFFPLHPLPLALVAAIIGILADLILVLLMSVGFILWIVLLINGFQGTYFKLPLIGRYAERVAGRYPL
jgi:uncharacterized membrane protein